MTPDSLMLKPARAPTARANFAGIGAAGQPGVGLSFPDLKTAVRAHTGRLLACSLPGGTGGPVQNQRPAARWRGARPARPHGAIRCGWRPGEWLVPGESAHPPRAIRPRDSVVSDTVLVTLRPVTSCPRA